MNALPLLLLGAMLPADDPPPPLGAEVAAVVRVDLDRLDLEDLLKRIGPGDQRVNRFEASKVLGSWVRAMKEAGARTLWIALTPDAMTDPPLALVPIGPDAKPRAIRELLTGPGARGPLRWPDSRVEGAVLVAGSPQAIERYTKGPNGPRPDLAAALVDAGDGPITLVLTPSATQRRVLEEQIPNLPKELGGASTSPILRGVRSIGLTLKDQPKPALSVRVQADDAKSLESARQFGRDVLKYLADRPGPSADAARELANAPAKVEGHSLSLEVNLEQATNLVSTPLFQVQEASGRSQCTNNLKQIALAMHNYHSAHGSFPPAYRADKAGKPLLSWRVLILPYLEQDALYKQFHLDEPWDSPHNLPLAAKVPPPYVCPESARAKAKEDQFTSYLAPRGPATVFPGEKAIKIQEITDGTSNTIMVVDASDDQAVVWTKPADWEVGAEPKLPAHHPDGTNTAFCDGSVRFLKASITPKLLLKLLTRNGGEVISADEY